MAPAVEESVKSYWSGLARAYGDLRPPLRPSDEDVQFMEATAAEHAREFGGRPVQALLLGVTPDIARMRWPCSCMLLGVDVSGAMAKAVWPGDVAGARCAVCGDWRALPCRDASLDIAIGDGMTTCVRYPGDTVAVARDVHRALKPGGILILRCFAQPEEREAPEKVFDDAMAGAIPTFTQFRFRLLMALQRNAREGIPVDRVYRFWADRAQAHEELIGRNGWKMGEIRLIEYYRGADTVHTFPTLAESRAVFDPLFEETALFVPTYFDGDRCPCVVLRKR